MMVNRMLIISRKEIEGRISKIISEMEEKNLDALYVASSSNIAYLLISFSYQQKDL